MLFDTNLLLQLRSMARTGVRRIAQRLKTTRALFNGELMVGTAALSARVFRADGTIEDLGVICRKKVTGAWVTFVVANMVTDSTEFGDAKYHDSGTGTTAEANTQTALVTATGDARVAGTQVAGGTATAPTYTSVATLPYTATLAITEHGLFTKSTSTTLVDRSVFSAVNVVNGDSIQFTYVLTLNAEA